MLKDFLMEIFIKVILKMEKLKDGVFIIGLMGKFIKVNGKMEIKSRYTYFYKGHHDTKNGYLYRVSGK